MMPESCDFASIERRIADIDTEIATIDKSIADAATAERAKYDRERALQSQVNDIRRKMDAIVNDAKNAAIADARKANAERDGWNNELRDLHSKMSTITIDINRRKASDDTTRKDIERQRERIAKLNDQVEAYRNQGKAENRRAFTGDKCPHCGQTLPPDMLADAEKTFHEKQTALKDSILADANAVKAQIEVITKDAADLESLLSVNPGKIAELEKEQSDTQARIDELNAKMQAFVPVKPADVVPENIIEWVNLNNQVTDLEKQIAGVRDSDTTDNGTSEITARKAELNAERANAVHRLADKDAIARANKEIADLEKHGKDVAQEIADLERLEFTMAQFSKRRVEEMEKRVNSLFTMVTWKLFDYTFDGNESETCVPMVNGVPFGRANTASRINAGLDIINALCRHFDVCAPIFLDNAECINEPIKTAGQVIKMYVTTDQTLIIK
jgi:exonuclease SbcC